MRVARVRLRRLLHRFDRTAPGWLTWLPSWGTSLLIHGLLLIVLATYYYVSEQSSQNLDLETSIISLADQDYSSLVPAAQSGDPFSNVQTEETPSISMDPTGTSIGQPETVTGLRYSPRMETSVRQSADRMTDLTDVIRAAPRAHVEDMTAPFSGRMGASKVQLLRREGGTTASERAVTEGLAWIARHQRKDGGWSLDTSGQCQIAPGCGQETLFVSDTAATGLALLPFLGAGHIHNQPSRYQQQVKGGIDWLIAVQQKHGELFLGGHIHSQFYSHAIASMALCEAYGLSKDPRLKQPAQQAINFIVESQNKYDGGWRYSPGMEGDTSVFGWQMFALRSARLAGLNVPTNVVKGCSLYLDQASTDKSRLTYSYLPGGNPTPVMTAEALLCRQYLGWPRDYPTMIKGVAGVWQELQLDPQRNIYYWYYSTQLLHNMQNKAWKQWNPQIREGLIATQIESKGCDQGSWSPFLPQPDRWGRQAGRLYQTSMSILTLEVYYRFLPLYRNTEMPAADTSPKL